MVDAQGPAKIVEIGATAHADVLASINQLTGGRVLEGAGTTTESIFGFEQRDGETTRRQSGGRRQSRQSAANNQNALGHAACYPAFASQARIYLMLSRAIVTGSGV